MGGCCPWPTRGPALTAPSSSSPPPPAPGWVSRGSLWLKPPQPVMACICCGTAGGRGESRLVGRSWWPALTGLLLIQRPVASCRRQARGVWAGDGGHVCGQAHGEPGVQERAHRTEDLHRRLRRGEGKHFGSCMARCCGARFSGRAGGLMGVSGAAGEVDPYNSGATSPPAGGTALPACWVQSPASARLNTLPPTHSPTVCPCSCPASGRSWPRFCGSARRRRP